MIRLFVVLVFLCLGLSASPNTADLNLTKENNISSLPKNFILEDDNLLSQKVIEKINTMGNELYSKTGVFVALALSSKKSLDELLAFQNELKQNEETKNFVLLALSTSSHKVEIITSKEVSHFLDTKQINEILSPSAPGTILPILTSPKGKDIYNAAMLNGYADIVDRLAKYFNTTLESSIGNANRDTINLLRILIYGFICIALLFYVQRKIKRKRNV